MQLQQVPTTWTCRTNTLLVVKSIDLDINYIVFAKIWSEWTTFLITRLRKRHHLNIDVWKRGLVFAKCIVCESFKDLISKLGKHSNDAIEYEMKLRKHILYQELCKNLYHTWRTKSI
jgi:hypothetical protein